MADDLEGRWTSMKLSNVAVAAPHLLIRKAV